MGLREQGHLLRIKGIIYIVFHGRREKRKGRIEKETRKGEKKREYGSD